MDKGLQILASGFKGFSLLCAFRTICWTTHPIVQLELLAIIFAILTLITVPAGTLTILLKDSMNSNLSLENNGAHTNQTLFLHLKFLQANGLDGGGSLLKSVRPVFEKSDSFTVFASRGRITDVHLLAEQTGV
jgi:hypothetical protein